REPMPGHPAADADADRGDLSLLDPDAGQTSDPPGTHPDGRERIDHHLLEGSYVPVHVLAMPAQVEDRIADQLPRSLIRDLPSPPRAHDRHRPVERVAEERRIAATTERVDRRMLEQQQDVGWRHEAAPEERLLPASRVRVVDAAGANDLER